MHYAMPSSNNCCFLRLYQHYTSVKISNLQLIVAKVFLGVINKRGIHVMNLITFALSVQRCKMTRCKNKKRKVEEY